MRELSIPFRSLILNLLSLLSRCGLRPHSLSFSVEAPDVAGAEGEKDDVGFDEANHPHLTAADFISQWLPSVALGLTLLSVGDYWCQACWRPSTALCLISEHCCNLLNLEMKNALLSVNGLKSMLNMINLRLKFIRLDGRNLDILNECFRFLLVRSVTATNEPQAALALPQFPSPVRPLSVTEFCHSLILI